MSLSAAPPSAKGQSSDIFKLLKDELPMFDGTDADMFLATFDGLVHDVSEISKPEKMVILRKHLTPGSNAAKCLDGYRPTELDYDAARLRSSFLNKNKIIHDRMRRISQLNPKSGGTKNLRDFLSDLEGNVKALQGQDRNVSNDFSLITKLLGRLPPKVYLALEKERIDQEEEWAMNFLLTVLNSYILLPESQPENDLKDNSKSVALKKDKKYPGPSLPPWKKRPDLPPHRHWLQRRRLILTLENVSSALGATKRRTGRNSRMWLLGETS